jgi:hypothetical protein
MSDVQRTFFGQDKPRAAPCPNAKPRKKPPAEKETIRRSVPVKVRDWLTRLTRIHAHARYTVRLFAHPETAGGQSLEGETYAARAARCDQTLIHDASMLIRDEADAIVAEVQAAMDAAPKTAALPGTRAKVLEMEARARRGQSIFVDADAKIG